MKTKVTFAVTKEIELPDKMFKPDPEASADSTRPASFSNMMLKKKYQKALDAWNDINSDFYICNICDADGRVIVEY